MKTFQSPKTKLQPLSFYHHQEDLDNQNHILELYDECENVNPPPYMKATPSTMKSLKALLYKNIVSSEKISSDEDLSFKDKPLTKTFERNKRNFSLLRESREKKPISTQDVLSMTSSYKNPLATKYEKVDGYRKNAARTKGFDNPKPMRVTENRGRERNGNKRVEKENDPRTGNFQTENDQFLTIEKYCNTSLSKSGIQNSHLSNQDGDSLKHQYIRRPREKFDSFKYQSPESKKSFGFSRVNNYSARAESLSPEFKSSLAHSIRFLTNIKTVNTETSTDLFPLRQSIKDFYTNILLDLSLSHSERERSEILGMHSSIKHEGKALLLVEERLGKAYADGLYDLFIKYCTPKDSTKKVITLGKFLLFLKQLDLFNQVVTRESVSLIFIKRCPHKFADFAGFIDILYKIHRLTETNSGDSTSLSKLEKDQRFQKFIQERIFEKRVQLENSIEGGNSLSEHTETDYFSNNNFAVEILQNHHIELKKIYKSYWPCHAKYQDRKSDTRKGIILQKEFKEFCYDYGIVPTLCTLVEVSQLFRRFQMDDQNAIDYQGFIKILCLVANIGFSKGASKQKFDSFPKKLIKLLSYISQVSNRTLGRVTF